MILRIPYVRCWWQAAQSATHARWIPYTAAQVAAHRAGRLVCKVLWLSLAFLPPNATVPSARLVTGATPRQAIADIPPVAWVPGAPWIPATPWSAPRAVSPYVFAPHASPARDVPEPSSLVLLGLGVVALAGVRVWGVG